jgi:preprotein translocase subunit Sss1
LTAVLETWLLARHPDEEERIQALRRAAAIAA